MVVFPWPILLGCERLDGFPLAGSKAINAIASAPGDPAARTRALRRTSGFCPGATRRLILEETLLGVGLCGRGAPRHGPMESAGCFDDESR